MLRPDDAPPLTRGVVLRGIGLAVAIALGAVAVWLIVTSTTQKRLELGVLAGLWAALVGAFAMFGNRRALHPLDHGAGDPADAHASGSAVQMRSGSTELERAEDVATRREHEERLEHLLRREIHSSVTREVASLRSEIAQLRTELLEKVGGQLRLERIETTRVIGSDLEALQHEVRQLKVAAQDGDDFGRGAVARSWVSETAPLRQIVEPARVRPVSRQTAEVEADVQPARVRPEPDVADAIRPEPQPEPQRSDFTEPTLSSQPSPAPAARTVRPDEPAPTGPELRPQPPAPIPPSAPAPASAAPAPAPSDTGPRAFAPQAFAQHTFAPQTPAPQSPAPPAPAPWAGPPHAPAPQTPAPASPPPQTPAPPTPSSQTSTPQTSTPQTPTPQPPQPPAPPPQTSPAAAPPSSPPASSDDFASLPRIRPFTDFELDPIEAEETYTGRRRRIEAAAQGKHALPPDEPGGRRRRDEDAEHDSELLARLLAREGADG